MIAITPWILFFAATCQDPKPPDLSTQTPVTQMPVTQTPVTPAPVVQAPVTQTPSPVPPAAGGTSDTKPPAQSAGDTKPASPTPISTEADKTEPAASGTQDPDKDKPVPDSTDAPKSEPDKSSADKSSADKSSADKSEPDKSDAKASEEPRQDDAGGWARLDGVGLIINQDIVTLGEIDDRYRFKYRDKPVANKEEHDRRRRELIDERRQRILAMQAGEDLGASEELIKLQINAWFDNVVQNHGGIVQMSKLLEARGQTPQDYRQDRREQIYVRLWEGLVTGEGTGTGKRPIRDRFVRPGELRFYYNEAMQDPGGYAVLGGTAETLTLQILLLDPKENGGMDKTMEFAQGLRQRILDGDDMSDLVRKYGKDKDGMMRDVPLAGLKRQFPSMGRFAEKAQVDDLSLPLRLPTKDGTYVQVLRLVDRTAGVKPELDSQAVQKLMTTRLQEKLDDRRKFLGYADLMDASYVWPDPRRKRK